MIRAIEQAARQRKEHASSGTRWLASNMAQTDASHIKRCRLMAPHRTQLNVYDEKIVSRVLRGRRSWTRNKLLLWLNLGSEASTYLNKEYLWPT